MASLLAGVFSARDPLAVALGLTRPQIERLIRGVAPRAIADGLTVLARADSGQLVGALLAEDFAAPPAPGVPEEIPEFEPIAELLDGLDNDYRKGRTIARGSHAHLFMLGVHPDFSGRGVAQTMVTLTLDAAEQHLYRCAVTEATGRVSQGIFRKLGFRDISVARYLDFRFKGQAVFSSISEHEGTILMEKIL